MLLRIVCFLDDHATELLSQENHRSRKPFSILRQEDVPQDELDREIGILTAIARQEDKPEAIIEKIIAGKLESYLKARALLEQPFARDTSITMGKFLQDAAMEVHGLRGLAAQGLKPDCSQLPTVAILQEAV